jgi:hypothetical protein
MNNKKRSSPIILLGLIFFLGACASPYKFKNIYINGEYKNNVKLIIYDNEKSNLVLREISKQENGQYKINDKNNNHELIIDTQNIPTSINGIIYKIKIELDNGQIIQAEECKYAFNSTLVVKYPNENTIKLCNLQNSSAGWGELWLIGADENEVYFKINEISFMHNLFNKGTYFRIYSLNWRNGNIREYY